MKIVLLFLTLVFVASAMSAGAEAVRFAVVPCVFKSDDTAKDWLGRGVAFDIEKRLERWSGMRAADRLRVRGASRSANVSDERAAAKAVLDGMNLDVVITLTGKTTNDQLDLNARVWQSKVTAGPEISVRGRLSELFALHGKLIDDLVPILRSIVPQLQAPEKPERMRIAPAHSVEAYKLMIRGMTLLQDGDSKSARTKLEEAFRLEPDMWWTHYFLGAVEFHEGNFDKAIQHCRAAVAVDPDLYPAVYANLAYCYQAVGDTEHFRWAKSEFERRSGKALPVRALPGRSI